MTRIVSISSSRSDVGILTYVWNEIARLPGIELHVFLTGAHVASGAQGVPDLPAGIILHKGGTDLGGRDSLHASTAMSRIVNDAARLYDRIRPDVILATGDRMDMFPAVLAAVPFNLPVAHLHGGERSEGAVDDFLRHATTKLAHLHFASSVGAANTLCGMGEEAWRIHVTGAPGLDTLRQAPEMSAPELAAELSLTEMSQLRLVTVHPETNSQAPLKPFEAVLDALSQIPGPTIFTAPNRDMGGEEIGQRIAAFVGKKRLTVYRETLGSRLYANAMRHASLMIGNSSSGIIEAALFGLPVVNVGDRQKNREHGDNVTNCSADAGEIVQAMHRMNGRRFSPGTASIYGDGRAAARIARILGDLPPRDRLLKKRFTADPGIFQAPWLKQDERAGARRQA